LCDGEACCRGAEVRGLPSGQRAFTLSCLRAAPRKTLLKCCCHFNQTTSKCVDMLTRPALETEPVERLLSVRETHDARIVLASIACFVCVKLSYSMPMILVDHGVVLECIHHAFTMACSVACGVESLECVRQSNYCMSSLEPLAQLFTAHVINEPYPNPWGTPVE